MKLISSVVAQGLTTSLQKCTAPVVSPVAAVTADVVMAIVRCVAGCGQNEDNSLQEAVKTRITVEKKQSTRG